MCADVLERGNPFQKANHRNDFYTAEIHLHGLIYKIIKIVYTHSNYVQSITAL